MNLFTLNGQSENFRISIFWEFIMLSPLNIVKWSAVDICLPKIILDVNTNEIKQSFGFDF